VVKRIIERPDKPALSSEERRQANRLRVLREAADNAASRGGNQSTTSPRFRRAVATFTPTPTPRVYLAPGRQHTIPPPLDGIELGESPGISSRQEIAAETAVNQTKPLEQSGGGDSVSETRARDEIAISPPTREDVMTKISEEDARALARKIQALPKKQRAFADALAHGDSIEKIGEDLDYKNATTVVAIRASVFRALGYRGKETSVAEKIADIVEAYRYTHETAAEESPRRTRAKGVKKTARARTGNRTRREPRLPVVAAPAEVSSPVHNAANGARQLPFDLPIRISLEGFGRIDNFDLVPARLDAGNLAEREQQIRDLREQGLTLAEVMVHPAWPTAQVLFIKRSEE
jgi:hypothetical protein